MKKVFLGILTVLLLVSLISCESPASSSVIKSLILSQSTVEVTEGESISLSVLIYPESATESVTWKSSNKTVATVDGKGRISALCPGKATIVVSSPNGITASCEVTVTEKSAYNQLNADEKAFVDSFVKYALNSFKNPSSVVIKKVMESDGNASLGAFWGFEASSENSWGGTTVQDFYLVKSTGRFVNGGNATGSLFNDRKFDCALITKAIQEKNN